MASKARLRLQHSQQKDSLITPTRPLPSPPHYSVYTLVPQEDYNSFSEILHDQTSARRHALHLCPLRAQRQHARLRHSQRQPPHPGRHRSQPARLQSPQPASDVFQPRPATAHLARLKISQQGPAIYAKSSPWNTVESGKRVRLSSELLTWYIGKLSAFCLQGEVATE